MKVPADTVRLIDGICANREFSHDDLMKSSDVYTRLVDANNQYLKPISARKGGVGLKEKVLMVAAIHLTSGTDQSVEWAVDAALQVGVSEAELRDAMDLALLTGGGAAIARVQLATSVLRHRQAGGGKRVKFEFAEQV
jgi:alkylhydroperoxidase/carboxymuconolactone decarboxylase family protein YurZ